ncbi:hypothetical protein AXFE_02260 [Acidithrix ferrooxidans]|uniref:Uncharacterized protein n=1 Tax=Acidithrix ferrooxidans TaxID=1280514 RepID=A0A0D8HLZ8_9ACTN|nr:hypothetical protein AXFE_02260 [Acidithrix ferrooxidans]
MKCAKVMATCMHSSCPPTCSSQWPVTHFFNVNLVDVKLALPPGLSFIEVISLFPSGFLLSIYCPTTSVVFQLLPPPAIRALAKFVQVSYSTGWLMLNKLPKAIAERNS